MAKLKQALCINLGFLPAKAGFKISTLDMGEIRFFWLKNKRFSNAGFGVSGVPEAEHKNNKLVIEAS